MNNIVKRESLREMPLFSRLFLIVLLVSLISLLWVPQRGLAASDQEIIMGGGVMYYNGDPAGILETTANIDQNYFNSHTLRGGYAAAGIAMRNLGSGNITISGIPRGAVVEQAFLYWAILNPTATVEMASGNFNGDSIEGTSIGSCDEPCWGAGLTHVYRADVTRIVYNSNKGGNGIYALSGFATGITTGGNPFEPDYILPMNEGATLVVIYRHNASAVQTIVMYDGCRFFWGTIDIYTFTIGGFVADPVEKATLTIFGADGQSGGLVWDPDLEEWVYQDPHPDLDKEYLEFNGSIIASPPESPWNGGDGRPLPQLWDTHTYDVTNLLQQGSKQVTVTNPRFLINASYDCIVWVGAVFGVTAKDTDSDGLVDAWETDGYDHDGDGIVDVPLPGADPLVKDIFVEIDYMVGTDHTHEPLTNAIDTIKNAFANAPEPVTLYVDISDPLTHDDLLGETVGNVYQWDEFDSIRNAYFAEARRPIYHYTIFAHNLGGQGTTSGYSKGVPGSDFIVALGSWTDQVGDTNQQAGTFMHELGHNIGLLHGGRDRINYKPNYLSVMNYFFQFPGLRIDGADGNFDYSRALYRNRSLQETKLWEWLGIGGPTNYGTRFTDPDCIVREWDTSRPIDWNWDQDTNFLPVAVDITPINIDINGVATCDGIEWMYNRISYDDWGALVLDGRALGVSTPGAFTVGISSEEDIREDPLETLIKLLEDSDMKGFRKAAREYFREDLKEHLGESYDDSALEYVIEDFIARYRKEASQKSQLPSLPEVIMYGREMSWRAIGDPRITHYNIYLVKKGAKKLVGSVPADRDREEKRWVYVFVPDTKGPRDRFGVTTVDSSGNESTITIGIDPLKELTFEEAMAIPPGTPAQVSIKVNPNGRKQITWRHSGGSISHYNVYLVDMEKSEYHRLANQVDIRKSKKRLLGSVPTTEIEKKFIRVFDYTFTIDPAIKIKADGRFRFGVSAVNHGGTESAIRPAD